MIDPIRGSGHILRGRVDIVGTFAATVSGFAGAVIAYGCGGFTLPDGIGFGKFVEVTDPETGQTIRVEWIPIPDFNPTIPLPCTVIVGTTVLPAVLQNNEFDIFSEASLEDDVPLDQEVVDVMGSLFGPLTTVFAPEDRTPLSDILRTEDDDSALGTVADAVGVGAGIGAGVGLIAGGPAGAAKGAGVGAALGAAFGIGFVIGEAIGEAIS
jgi:hypothetical protein